MDSTKFKKLTESYVSKRGSWAIWNGEKDKYDKKYIKLADLTIILDNVDKLHTKYVIIGFNPSPPIPPKIENPDKQWEAFHPVNRPRNHDRKLYEAFKGTKVWGAYMTDLIKEDEVNVNKMRKDIDAKNNSEKKEDHKKYFQAELTCVGVTPHSIFILLGKDARELFFDFINGTPFSLNTTICLPHYAFLGKKPWEWVVQAKEAINAL